MTEFWRKNNFLFPNCNRWNYKHYIHSHILQFLHVLFKSFLEATQYIHWENGRNEKEREEVGCLHSCYLFDFKEDVREWFWCCSPPKTYNKCSKPNFMPYVIYYAQHKFWNKVLFNENWAYFILRINVTMNQSNVWKSII
jgi:hypothetical protein